MPESGAAADTDPLRSRCDELLDQLEYTADEIESLRRVIDRVPEELLSLVPEEGARSIKAILGHIMVRDTELAIALSEGVDKPATDVAWESQAIDELLSEIQQKRRSFVSELRLIAGRAGDTVLTQLEGTLTRIVVQDVEAFREVAMRLHSAGIGAR